MSQSITLINTGQSFKSNHGETLLSAAQRHGINLPHGCTAGACGTCKSTLLTGKVTYPDGTPFALLDDDIVEGKCLPCCAVAISDVELDADDFGTDFEPWS